MPNKHNVTYEYKSGTAGMDIPDALKDKAPSKVKGDTVTSPAPTGKEEEFRDGAGKGRWKFKSYDKSEVTIVDKDEHVVGTWVFEKDPAPKTYNVKHKFESEDPNVELPEAVKKLLPSDQTGKKDGSKVTPTEPNTKKVETNEGTIYTEAKEDAITVDNKDEQSMLKIGNVVISSVKGKLADSVLNKNVIKVRKLDGNMISYKFEPEANGYELAFVKDGYQILKKNSDTPVNPGDGGDQASGAGSDKPDSGKPDAGKPDNGKPDASQGKKSSPLTGDSGLMLIGFFVILALTPIISTLKRRES